MQAEYSDRLEEASFLADEVLFYLEHNHLLNIEILVAYSFQT